MRIEPFHVAHLDAMALQPHQRAWRAGLSGSSLGWLAEPGDAWTGFVDGRPVACAGLLDLGGGRAEAWALCGVEAGRVMVPLTRALGRGLAASAFRYVQAHTARDFAPARRWVALLGFRFAAVLPRYCDDGGDAELWTRVN
jgi:hypothetical protein